MKGAKCIYGCATCAWKGSRYTLGILYQVRLMIRGDVIGARVKSSKGLGMAGKGWDL